MPVNDLKKQTAKPFRGNKNKARESKVRDRLLEMKQPKKTRKTNDLFDNGRLDHIHNPAINV